MMKPIVLGLILLFSIGRMSAQEMTLMLQMPDPFPNPGEEFFVEIWCTNLEYPGYTLNGGVPTLKSGQMGLSFDPNALTPIKTDGPPPLQKYAWNLNQMFIDYGAVPGELYANPGDLRFVSFTTYAPGMDLSFYGGAPFHLWDLKFLYSESGGNLNIWFQDTDKKTKVDYNLPDRLKEKFATFWTAWDNVEYEMILGGSPPWWMNEWIGTNSNIWNDPLNWTEGVPTGLYGENVYILEYGNFSPTIYASAVARNINLTFEQLSIAPGGNLTVTNQFSNEGVLHMSNIEGVSASYINLGSSSGSGTFQYDRHVFASGSNPSDSTDSVGWHTISAPIDGFSTDSLLDYYVKQWDEIEGTWLNYDGTEPCDPFSPAETLEGIETWNINYDTEWPYPDIPGGPCTGGTDTILEFTGPFTSLHEGEYSAQASVSGAEYSGWNAFGNPYTSAIDPSLFNWTNFENLLWGIALFDGATGNYIYSTLGNGFPYTIGPTQGFFMQAVTPATFSLSGKERVHDNGTNIFKDEITDLLRIEATGEGTSDVTFIRIMEDAEFGLDKADFPKRFTTTENLPQIYTTASDELLAVNALPNTLMVPMGFTSVTTGIYTISAIETSEFDFVVLEDLLTGVQNDLLSDNYTFNYSVGNDNDRFLIHFSPMAIKNTNISNIEIWTNDHKIYIQSPERKGNIVVFNMMGQDVIRTKMEPGLNILRMSNKRTFYIVKVTSTDYVRTIKVFVK